MTDILTGSIVDDDDDDDDATSLALIRQPLELLLSAVLYVVVVTVSDLLSLYNNVTQQLNSTSSHNR